MITFGEAIALFYRRYFDFQGRSQRSEFWWMQVYFLVLFILPLAVALFFVGSYEDEADADLAAGRVVIIFGLLWLSHAIGAIALSVRRFHDLGQTGWLWLVFLLLGVLPAIGLLFTLGQYIWFMFPGTRGPNKYGHDPLHGDQADIFT